MLLFTIIKKIIFKILSWTIKPIFLILLFFLVLNNDIQHILLSFFNKKASLQQYYTNFSIYLSPFEGFFITKYVLKLWTIFTSVFLFFIYYFIIYIYYVYRILPYSLIITYYYLTDCFITYYFSICVIPTTSNLILYLILIPYISFVATIFLLIFNIYFTLIHTPLTVFFDFIEQIFYINQLFYIINFIKINIMYLISYVYIKIIYKNIFNFVFLIYNILVNFINNILIKLLYMFIFELILEYLKAFYKIISFIYLRSIFSLTIAYIIKFYFSILFFIVTLLYLLFSVIKHLIIVFFKVLFFNGLYLTFFFFFLSYKVLLDINIFYLYLIYNCILYNILVLFEIVFLDWLRISPETLGLMPRIKNLTMYFIVLNYNLYKFWNILFLNNLKILWFLFDRIVSHLFILPIIFYSFGVSVVFTLYIKIFIYFDLNLLPYLKILFNSFINIFIKVPLNINSYYLILCNYLLLFVFIFRFLYLFKVLVLLSLKNAMVINYFIYTSLIYIYIYIYLVGKKAFIILFYNLIYKSFLEYFIYSLINLFKMFYMWIHFDIFCNLFIFLFLCYIYIYMENKRYNLVNIYCAFVKFYEFLSKDYYKIRFDPKIYNFIENIRINLSEENPNNKYNIFAFILVTYVIIMSCLLLDVIHTFIKLHCKGTLLDEFIERFTPLMIYDGFYLFFIILNTIMVVIFKYLHLAMQDTYFRWILPFSCYIKDIFIEFCIWVYEHLILIKTEGITHAFFLKGYYKIFTYLNFKEKLHFDFNTLIMMSSLLFYTITYPYLIKYIYIFKIIINVLLDIYFETFWAFIVHFFLEVNVEYLTIIAVIRDWIYNLMLYPFIYWIKILPNISWTQHKVYILAHNFIRMILYMFYDKIDYYITLEMIHGIGSYNIIVWLLNWIHCGFFLLFKGLLYILTIIYEWFYLIDIVRIYFVTNPQYFISALIVFPILFIKKSLCFIDWFKTFDVYTITFDPIFHGTAINYIVTKWSHIYDIKKLIYFTYSITFGVISKWIILSKLSISYLYNILHYMLFEPHSNCLKDQIAWFMWKKYDYSNIYKVQFYIVWWVRHYDSNFFEKVLMIVYIAYHLFSWIFLGFCLGYLYITCFFFLKYFHYVFSKLLFFIFFIITYTIINYIYPLFIKIYMYIYLNIFYKLFDFIIISLRSEPDTIKLLYIKGFTYIIDIIMWFLNIKNYEILYAAYCFNVIYNIFYTPTAHFFIVLFLNIKIFFLHFIVWPLLSFYLLVLNLKYIIIYIPIMLFVETVQIWSVLYNLFNYTIFYGAVALYYSAMIFLNCIFSWFYEIFFLIFNIYFNIILYLLYAMAHFFASFYLYLFETHEEFYNIFYMSSQDIPLLYFIKLVLLRFLYFMVNTNLFEFIGLILIKLFHFFIFKLFILLNPIFWLKLIVVLLYNSTKISLIQVDISKIFIRYDLIVSFYLENLLIKFCLYLMYHFDYIFFFFIDIPLILISSCQDFLISFSYIIIDFLNHMFIFLLKYLYHDSIYICKNFYNKHLDTNALDFVEYSIGFLLSIWFKLIIHYSYIFFYVIVFKTLSLKITIICKIIFFIIISFYYKVYSYIVLCLKFINIYYLFKIPGQYYLSLFSMIFSIHYNFDNYLLYLVLNNLNGDLVFNIFFECLLYLTFFFSSIIDIIFDLPIKFFYFIMLFITNNILKIINHILLLLKLINYYHKLTFNEIILLGTINTFFYKIIGSFFVKFLINVKLLFFFINILLIFIYNLFSNILYIIFKFFNLLYISLLFIIYILFDTLIALLYLFWELPFNSDNVSFCEFWLSIFVDLFFNNKLVVDYIDFFNNWTIYVFFLFLFFVYVLFLQWYCAKDSRLFYVDNIEFLFITFMNLIKNIIQDNSPKNIEYFGLYFVIFFVIYFCNLIGMIPYSVSITSQFIFCLTISFMVLIGITLKGIYKHGFKFGGAFLNNSSPWLIWFLLVPLEVISFFSRGLSLAIRLFANMTAGHVLIGIFGGVISTLTIETSGFLELIASIIAFILFSAILFLELFISFLQAYVFILLVSLYIKEIEDEPGH